MLVCIHFGRWVGLVIDETTAMVEEGSSRVGLTGRKETGEWRGHDAGRAGTRVRESGGSGKAHKAGPGSGKNFTCLWDWRFGEPHACH
jgi:hypothetical protein